MPTVRQNIPSASAPGAVESTDPVLNEIGMRELRNVDLSRGRWDCRLGWAKDNAVAMSWKRCIGWTAYQDRLGATHAVVVGDDNTIWHKVWDAAGVVTVDWASCTIHDAVIWDGTNIATFAPWRDDCFIAIGSTSGTGQNLRYDGLRGVVFGVSLATPTGAPAAADNGAGNLSGGTYDYYITFYDAFTGWESDHIAAPTLTLSAGPAISEVQTLTLDAVTTAGDFTLKYDGYETEPIAWNAAVGVIEDALEELPNITPGDVVVGGAALNAAGVTTFTFLAALGNASLLQIDRGNLTGPAQAVIVETTAGNATGSATRRVRLTGIPTYPGTGRTIYRRIYRSSDAEVFVRLNGGVTAELMNNTGQEYDDNQATASGETYIRRQVIPVMKHVSVQNELVIWANDVTHNEPATIYIAYNENHPEAIGHPLFAGTDDDPITGLKKAVDMIFVAKLGAWHRIPRQCEVCERIIDGVGALASATIQLLGNVPHALDQQGAIALRASVEEQWGFVGSKAFHFDLADTWEATQEDRWDYAGGGHDRRRRWLVWAVQMCTWQGLTGTGGPHNDTLLIWDYGARQADRLGGRMWVMDMMVDHMATMPAMGGRQEELWGAFPMGYVGPLFDGVHGDGVDDLIEVAVESVDGKQVTIGTTNLLTGEPLALGLEGFRGSVLHIVRGTGMRPCRPVLPCDRPKALIVDHSLVSAGRFVTLAGELTLDATSVALIGGYQKREWIAEVTMGDQDAMKTLKRVFVERA